MASYSNQAPIATQEEFAELCECGTDSFGKSDSLSHPDTLERENKNGSVPNVANRTADTVHTSIDPLNSSKQNISAIKSTKDEINILDDSTFPNRSHDGKNGDMRDEDCNSGTGSRYFLRTSSSGSQFKTPKGGFVYSKSCDGSPLRLGPETAILGYIGKRCRDCDTLSHEQGQHSSETLFLEELYGCNSKMNSSKVGTFESLVVFNTVTGQRLLPDGCEEQTSPTDDEQRTAAVTKSDNSDDVKSKLHDTCMLVCKKILVYAASNVGLACIVVGYAILGAIIFQSLEAWNEKKTRSTISEIRTVRMEELRNIANKIHHLNKESWTKNADEIMKKFQRELYTKTKGQGWDGVDDVVGGERDWTFVGALLYSVTLITTIGYGDITPKTPGGRIATMFYAMFGIPLTLLCLANLGNVMAQTFRQLFYRMEFKIENLFSYLKGRYKASKYRITSRNPFIRFCTRHFPCRKNKNCNAEMELDEIKKLDKLHETNCEPCRGVCNSEFPFEHAESQIAVECKESEHGLCRDDENLPCNSACNIDTYSNENDKESRSKSVGSMDVDLTFPTVEGDHSQQEEENVRDTLPKAKHEKPKGFSKGMSVKQRKKLARDVPIWVCLIIVMAYNLLGSVLFGLWEKGWGFLTGFYFCFITLSTIGFGDVVPGHSMESWQSQEKQIICTIYLLVGLAMLAMCFDLMQRQIRERAKHCAIWMGLLDENGSEKITAV
ncbi:uncharacterized protein LOC117333763 [Pecten maximus]|uniref:uncharacterized protein LOC117333763 n=1 Tax=Pecten maximus TaxID=6579 RepID=UPI001458F9E2|nr:uncharacterized protein LOC117333763 [Pecten maximus]